ncbi:hypothetical protein ACFGWE_03590 [Pasteurella multocida]|uniref:hypothetical protein n=1 Tax=Pasteurella multocida TaxID=747 RepID=UPI002945A71B|nr:hypothetical protein [Pasteurella multocida]HDR1088776.1 hypothetical protein [Pasteurella multocida]HDR1886949.1 hypothetical protein [Pasteurella multocida]HED4458349.1 hypothetical protein [Pasteurella multocida]
MTVADKNLDALPVTDLNTTDFNGTGGTGWDDEGTLDGADRGDEVTTPSDETPPEQKPEETEQEPSETEQEPEETEQEPEQEPEETEQEPEHKPKKHTNKRVPYERLQKEIQKRKELEAQLAAATQNAPESTAPDVDINYEVSIDNDKFKAMSDAMLEGDAETAQRMFADMLSANVNAAAKAAAQAASKQAYEIARAEAESSIQSRQILSEAQEAASIVMDEFDVFNESSENFNEDMLNEAIALRDGLVASGYSIGEAIIKAAEFTASNHGITAKSAVVADEPPKQQVKKPDVKAKMQQAAKNPPKTRGEPATTSEIDPYNMTMEEFDKLDPKEIAKLRGDFV